MAALGQPVRGIMDYDERGKITPRFEEILRQKNTQPHAIDRWDGHHSMSSAKVFTNRKDVPETTKNMKKK